MRISNKFRIKAEVKFGILLFGLTLNTFWLAITILQFRGFVIMSLPMMLLSTLLCYFGLFVPSFVEIVCPKCGCSCKEEHNYCHNCGIEFKRMRKII